MAFGTSRPKWAMAIWMSASFASFIAPIVTSAFLTPAPEDDWKAMIALLVPMAFAVGYLGGGPPLDERGMDITWRIRSVEPAFAAILAGMALAAPTSFIAVLVLHLAGGATREAALIAVAAPISLGGTAVYLLRVFWPAE
jgi:hypothetical protein